MDIWKEIYKTILKDRKKKMYMRALSMTMAGVLVFVTTYSMILPAITMDVETAENMPGFDGVLLDDEEDAVIDQDSNEIIFEDGDDGFDFDGVFTDEDEFDEDDFDFEEEELIEFETEELTEAETETEGDTETETEAVTETETETEDATEAETEEVTEAETETEELTEAETEEITEAETEEITEAETEEITEAETEEITEAETEELTEAETEELTEAETEVSLPAQSFEANTASVTVRVSAPEGAFPDGTTLSVQDIDDNGTLQAIENETADETKTVTKIHAVDISFIGPDGNEIEPLVPIRVEMTPMEIPEADNTVVVHVDDQGRTETVETMDPAQIPDIYAQESYGAELTEAAETDAVSVQINEVSGSLVTSPDTVTFEAGTFSVYALVYTVDFHYEANGKMYEFGIPGGGFVSFCDLIELLGIADDEVNSVSENEDEWMITESAKKFVADIENVEFSSPELVWVGKVETETTVGELKAANGLEVQYSAELTEEQIAEIDAQTATAGDWALISVLPFLSEESLTVTMKNGDQFVVKVTDAQISTHVITADGEDFIITVTYGDDALIPEGAVLEAEEIVAGTKEYEEYLSEAKEVLHNQYSQETEAVADTVFANETFDAADVTDYTETEASEAIEEEIAIDFARFFDIRIMAGKEKIEPAAPVEVSITYADSLNVDEEQKVCAVHFAEEGTEVIDTSSDQEAKSVVFMQGSFSVTGTIVTSGGTWPTSGSSYVIYVQSGGRYYAIAHDGTLHQVSVSGNSITFPDDANTFDLNSYLWTYEQHSDYWGRATRFVYYHDGQGYDHYLSPNAGSGLSETSTNLSRDNSGRIYFSPGYGSSSYIGINNGTIVGNQNNNNAVSIQFASNFVLPGKATIHFVDRNGNPLSGVSYTGSADYPVTANEDGTFTVRYNWDMGNAEYTLHLDKDFSKTGYTYASTHLAGTRQGTELTYNGLTMDAALKERNNKLYYYADAGNGVEYGSLPERNINDALRVPNEAGTGVTDYLGANVNKDIYVILDPVPTGSTSQQIGNDDVEDPSFSKTLEPNDDGTYTLSLNVTGRGINAASNPKANVIFVVDTSSSMDKTEGTGTGYSRLHDTKPALKTLAYNLLLSNSMSGKDDDTVEVAMVSFDGGVVNELDWSTSYSAFENKVDTGLVLHRGTDWEDALQRAYEVGLAKQAAEPDQQVFVVFFTDGEASQYRSFHGAGTYSVAVNPNYARWYSYFLSRESTKDEARAIVNAGMQFYAIYAFNQDGSKYNGEAGSDLLRNLVKYAYNSETLGNKNFFAKATSTSELEAAFNSILLSVREFLGFSDVIMNDDITSLTSTGINLVSSAVGGFTYSRSGGKYGNGTTWTDAPAATHVDATDGDVTSVKWDLGSTVLEDGVTYTVSFKVWPSQEAYDWLANLQNGTKTWADVVAAGLDAPNGSNPQIVKNGDSYSLLTNKPSVNGNGDIINNKITYEKTHSETVTEDDIPTGTRIGRPIVDTDNDGNRTTTTYTLDHGVYTKTVVTEKESYFKNPDPMPLEPERMNVLKKWATSMNTSHPADELKFRVLVDGKYYQNDGSLAAGEAGQANAKVLPVSNSNSWVNSINIAPGIVKYYDDDGNALSEALVLETGHKYSLEEFDLMEGGSAFLYYTSYEFHSQTMRPMIVDGTLKYLVLIDAANPAPTGAQTYTIGAETYYVAASGSGQGTMSGTNYRTAELDVTKIIRNSSGAEVTDEYLDGESFTYRVTLSIPDGTDPAGIVGYEYIPRTQSNAYTLYGYQTGETGFESDIERFSGKTFRAWNTLVYRDLVEWENIGGRIVSKTDDDGNILWKVAKDADGYHSITYDMTLNRNEVIRFTNLPTGTKYRIQEIYANYYQADNMSDSAGHAPVEKESNIADEGYAITQVLTTNGTLSRTAVANDTVSGTIDTPNVRYYNQFTNDLTSVKTKITILKTDQGGSRPLPGAVFDLYDEAGYHADPKEALRTGLTSSDEDGKEGTIELGNLSDGTYYLVETSAPAGYVLLADPVTITVAEGDITYSQENSSMDENGTGKTGSFQAGYQLIVVNDEGVALPNTGGAGTNLIYLTGIILTGLAGAGLVMRRRRRNEA